MPLSKSQQSLWQKALAYGAGGQAVALTEASLAYVVVRIAADLDLLSHFPELASEPPDFYSSSPDRLFLSLGGLSAVQLFERLVELEPDAEMYFGCLTALHRSRLKYSKILATQPFPTVEQVGPRGLLQFGSLSPNALLSFLMWRKWFFDIDNRAGQETGYLFEPIIAGSIGGIAVPAAKSPVRRTGNPDKGRQVDCLINNRAYEIKLRVTIAASGQGRWGEELDYPEDCRNSGFVPVLVCLDATSNPKLDALVAAFHAHGGESFVGDAAWQHLGELAGTTMGIFVEKYVRTALQQLLVAPSGLPDLLARCSESRVTLAIAGEELVIQRQPVATDSAPDEVPSDVDAGEIWSQ